MKLKHRVLAVALAAMSGVGAIGVSATPASASPGEAVDDAYYMPGRCWQYTTVFGLQWGALFCAGDAAGYPSRTVTNLTT